MPLELDGIGTGVLPDRLVVGWMTITDDAETAIGRTQGKQTVQSSGGRANVTPSVPTSSPLLPSSFLLWRSAPGAGVGRGVDTVDEPRLRPDGGGNAEGQVLSELEGLEVIEHDGLVDSALECRQGAPQKQQRVPTEKLADSGDSRRSAPESPGQLAVGGPGLESCGHRSQQFRPFPVVGEGKRAAGERLAAAEAEEAGNSNTPSGAVRRVLPEAKAVGPGVVSAVLPGAEAGAKILHAINGCTWPVHATCEGKPRAWWRG